MEWHFIQQDQGIQLHVVSVVDFCASLSILLVSSLFDCRAGWAAEKNGGVSVISSVVGEEVKCLAPVVTFIFIAGVTSVCAGCGWIIQ